MGKLGEGVHNIYKERAAKGGDVLWHVTIKGQKELSPGIPLHMSLKVFENNKEMDLKEIKAKVKEFDIHTPDPKKLKFEPVIFTSERDGVKYYMLKVTGHDKSYTEFYNAMKHCGTVYKSFMCHVTVDKDLYEKVKKDGLKPEEVKFQPLCIEAGAGNTVHEFEKMEKSEKDGQGKGMEITPNEIHSIEEAGVLDNSPVKMIRTKGGFWIAIGRTKGSAREEALAAGSHPAIVKYNLEQQHPQFQPAMMKNEFLNDSMIVEKHSQHLSEDLRKSGHEIYSVQNGSDIEFHITKHGHDVGTSLAFIQREHMLVKSIDVTAEFTKALAGATVEKAVALNVGLKIKR